MIATLFVLLSAAICVGGFIELRGTGGPMRLPIVSVIGLVVAWFLPTHDARLVGVTIVALLWAYHMDHLPGRQ